MLHCLRVMLNTSNEEEMITAVLHDTIEDGGCSPERLREEGVPDNIIEALSCLTRHQDEPYDQYLLKVSANPLATAVKIADLTDNLDLNRIKDPTSKSYKRHEKYRKALDYLLSIKGEV
ncbi:GTP pyrophosphokinase [Phosphitispora fastidiosa]|uniref:GTP pyrophosphokinase n=1 Tax=Phosphitispora fastidiosa TaxID=2837202 RepID=UPI001E5F48E0|nr:GTP pyrophosphokinase [Phosphitispora fastidiosa]MBU7006871.1 (p)ppGpp synthase/HD superfamily hydrolase [Phosphitispora fastidiosa]